MQRKSRIAGKTIMDNRVQTCIIRRERLYTWLILQLPLTVRIGVREIIQKTAINRHVKDMWRLEVIIKSTVISAIINPQTSIKTFSLICLVGTRIPSVHDGNGNLLYL
jgi:hypothetical protein